MSSLWNKLRNEDCKACKLSSTTNNVCLIGAGKIPADIMIIGEAPSKRLEDIHKPFAGKSGKFLDIILEELDLSREEVYITNVVHCRPPEGRKPSMDEMRACRSYLLKEIKYVNPSTIILLGDTAVKGLFDSNLVSIGKERGKILNWEGRKVIVTYHPAAALRNNYYIKVILEDLHKGLNHHYSIKEDKRYYYEVKSSNRKEIFRKLKNSPIITIDVETTGLDYMDKNLELVSINTSVKPHESYVWKASDLDYIKEILKDKELVINHNIKFDLQWLNRYGIWVKSPIFDTMVAKHLLDENYPDKSLEHLAGTDLGMQDLYDWKKKMDNYRKAKKEIPWSELVPYGARDTDATIRLYEKYSQMLEDEGLSELMKTEMKILKTLTRMEIFGISIDRKVHRELTVDYKKRIDKAKAKITKLVGVVNLNSPKQLAFLLYEKYQLPILKETKSGAPSCDEETILKLIELPKLNEKQKIILEALLSYREVVKLYTTYLAGLITNNYLKEDGKVHCDFKICGTKTGRLSCAEPNLQNIPREGDIKKMFISSFKNGRLIQLDYSQVELRILAHYANDKALIKAFIEGRDIHRETTAKCLKKAYEKVTENERKVIGKRVNFGIVYQISGLGLSQKIGCTPDEAFRYIRNWYEEFPLAKKWMNQKEMEIIETGRSVSFNGRVRRLYGATRDTREGREAIRQGINSPVQGGAGDITKWSMYRVDRRLAKLKLKARVWGNVHDAIMIDSPKEEVKTCIKVLNEICKETQVPLRVPLEFEIKVGKNWKDLEEVK